MSTLKSSVNYLSEFPGSDVIFEVENTWIYANKMNICFLSPVFKAMLEGDFMEKHLKKIKLPDKNVESFAFLYQCFIHQVRSYIS